MRTRALFGILLFASSFLCAQSTVDGAGTVVTGIVAGANGGGLPAGCASTATGSITCTGTLTSATAVTSDLIQKLPLIDVTHPAFGTPSSCANAADPTGTLDSTCAVNAALTFQQTAPVASHTETVLRFPAGNYLISSELRIPCTVHVRGDGKNATLLTFTNASAYAGVVIVGYGSGGAQPPLLADCEGSMSDLTLTTNGYSHNPLTMLELVNASGYTVKDVRMNGTGGRGLNITPGSERTSFRDLEIDSARWPIVSLGNEVHFWKTNIAGPGNGSDNYCYGANCVNGVGFNHSWTGTFSVVSATGNGSTATYVLTCSPTSLCPNATSNMGGQGGVNATGGVSPIPAGDWFTIAGVTGNTGLNGTFQASTVTNNSPATEFTITAANTNSGAGVVGSATFQPTAIPETHAAVTLSGANVEFNGGSIKQLWYANGLQTEGGGNITVQNVYFEGFPANGFPILASSFVLNGLQPTTTIAGSTFSATGCTGGSPCVQSVADDSWMPTFVSDPQDIGAISSFGMYIAPCDYDPTVTTQSACAPAGVMRNMYEYVTGGFTSGNLFYVTSRSPQGSITTAPTNTAWPVGSYVLNDQTANFGIALTSISNHTSGMAPAGNAKWANYCVDSLAVGVNAGSTSQYSCASIKVGVEPDGMMEFAPNSAELQTPWGSSTAYLSINDEFAAPSSEVIGNWWVKAFSVGDRGNTVNLMETASGQNTGGETSEVLTGQNQIGGNVPVQAVQYATGYASHVVLQNLTNNLVMNVNSQFGNAASWYDATVSNNNSDTLLGSNPGMVHPFGEQYATAKCWWDVGNIGTNSGHAANRFCLEGSPLNTGTSAGLEYDTWNGSAWVKKFGFDSTGGTVGVPGTGQTNTWTATQTFTPGGGDAIDANGLVKVTNAQLQVLDSSSHLVMRAIPGAGLQIEQGALYLQNYAAVSGSATFQATPQIQPIDQWYNTSNTTSYTQFWNQFNDTSNTAATVTPTKINRQFYCSINNSGTCLPYVDTIAYPSAGGSTLKWQNVAMSVDSGASLGVSNGGTIAATSLSAASALPNNTTATTQVPVDASTDVATDAYVQTLLGRARSTITLNNITGGTYNLATSGTGAVINWTASGGVITSIGTIFNGASGYAVGDVITPVGGNYDAYLWVTTVSGTAITGLSILSGGSGYSSATNITVYPAIKQAMVLTLNGTLTSNATVLGAYGTNLTTSYQFVVNNNTTGAYTTTFYQGNGSGGSTGTGVVVPQGTANSSAEWLQSDGVTDIWPVSRTLATSLTTTSATSDIVTLSGMTAAGHCSLTPTNLTAATNLATSYISTKAANSVTVTHTATSGMTYDLLCTMY